MFLALSNGVHTGVHGPPAASETFPGGLGQNVGELKVISTSISVTDENEGLSKTASPLTSTQSHKWASIVKGVSVDGPLI